MTEHETITIKLLKENKGNYIQLGGKGGMFDGLKFQPYKIFLFRILGLRIRAHKRGNDVFDGVYLRGYRLRKLNVLPKTSFNQRCRIFTPKEHKKLTADWFLSDGVKVRFRLVNK